MTRPRPTPDGGVLAGLIVILGLTYLWLGGTWLVSPTPTRLAGIEWAGLAAHLIGAWWLAGGVVALVGGILARRPAAAGTAAAVAILTPALVAGIFAVSVLHGNSRGLITAGSYLPYALIAAWAAWQTGRRRLTTLRHRQEAQ